MTRLMICSLLVFSLFVTESVSLVLHGYSRQCLIKGEDKPVPGIPFCDVELSDATDGLPVYETLIIIDDIPRKPNDTSPGLIKKLLSARRQRKKNLQRSTQITQAAKSFFVDLLPNTWFSKAEKKRVEDADDKNEKQSGKISKNKCLIKGEDKPVPGIPFCDVELPDAKVYLTTYDTLIIINDIPRKPNDTSPSLMEKFFGAKNQEQEDLQRLAQLTQAAKSCFVNLLPKKWFADPGEKHDEDADGKNEKQSGKIKQSEPFPSSAEIWRDILHLEEKL